MDKEQKAEQIVNEIFNNFPKLKDLDMEERLKTRQQLIMQAKEGLIDKTGESDWNVTEVYKSLELKIKDN
ncbi:MAG: hypothetical protein OEY34_07070 [Cyclobacteriaceae bacterium]|nr:hypothetical protein [Cyclobacteriaceae bacterium]